MNRVSNSNSLDAIADSSASTERSVTMMSEIISFSSSIRNWECFQRQCFTWLGVKESSGTILSMCLYALATGWPGSVRQGTPTIQTTNLILSHTHRFSYPDEVILFPYEENDRFQEDFEGIGKHGVFVDRADTRMLRCACEILMDRNTLRAEI